MADNKPSPEDLTRVFKFAAEMDLNNKEVAALMGIDDEENPETLPGGLISRLGLTEAKLARSQEKKRRKKFKYFLLQEIIRKALRDINRIIADLQNRIEELLEQITKAEDHLSELDEQYKILDDELKFFCDIGLFDLGSELIK